jgi:hypothetical protein
MATVVGSPIHLEKNPDPTTEEIDRVHAEYVKSLVELFEAHKHKYGIEENAHLELN